MGSVVRSAPSSFLNSCTNQVDDYVVEVVAAQVGIAVGGEYLEHAAAKFEN